MPPLPSTNFPSSSPVSPSPPVFVNVPRFPCNRVKEHDTAVSGTPPCTRQSSVSLMLSFQRHSLSQSRGGIILVLHQRAFRFPFITTNTSKTWSFSHSASKTTFKLFPHWYISAHTDPEVCYWWNTLEPPVGLLCHLDQPGVDKVTALGLSVPFLQL